MAAKFNPGDIMQLKSGGPAMTFSSSSSGDGYYCEWFKGASKERAHFNDLTPEAVYERSGKFCRIRLEADQLGRQQ